jgi:hypothetical protein
VIPERLRRPLDLADHQRQVIRTSDATAMYCCMPFSEGPGGWTIAPLLPLNASESAVHCSGSPANPSGQCHSCHTPVILLMWCLCLRWSIYISSQQALVKFDACSGLAITDRPYHAGPWYYRFGYPPSVAVQRLRVSPAGLRAIAGSTKRCMSMNKTPFGCDALS